MAIDVTCDECFQSYKVKEQHAGKKFRCKECDAVVHVPAELEGDWEDTSEPWDDDDDADLAPPVSRRRSRTPSSSTQKKRRRPQASPTDEMGLGKPATYLLGGLVLLLLSGLVIPRLLGFYAIAAALIGLAMLLLGTIRLLVCAFQDDPVCLALWFVVPFYNVYFIITRWPTTARPVLFCVVGIAVSISGPLAANLLLRNPPV